MKKRRVTYGVSGMVEYQAVIKMGRAQMKVTFADGSATGYGMNPAMYTTDNAMTQSAIENSEQYRSGLIYVVNSVELDGEVKVARKAAAPPQPAPPQPSPQGRENEDVSGEDGAEEAVVTEVEFDSNDDAKDYLEREFGCVRSKLRTRADIVEAGLKHGVSVNFA